MTLIKSISGIRGTLGGKPGDTLSPVDVTLFTAAFGTLIKKSGKGNTVVIGRDARLSGELFTKIIAGTLQGLGIDVLDAGLASTPTVEMTVVDEQAAGGIILTASHNPIEWNALKLLNEKGEFISASEGQEILKMAEAQDFHFAEVMKLGSYTVLNNPTQKHIDHILKLEHVDAELIAGKAFNIVVDGINSVGGVAVPEMLRQLGVKKITEINCEPTGLFKREPEPLPQNLIGAREAMQKGQYDLGIVVDPDVDRLVFLQEDGEPFGEEYTLVAVADYLLGKNAGGNTVSNLSSTRALQDITERFGGSYAASAVGEVNVVEKMKATNALIGGEGNGGIIYPALHYGRDALAGIALFLTHLARTGQKMSELKQNYPQYAISKNKLALTPNTDVDAILKKIQEVYKDTPQNTADGVRLDFDKEWVHLRKSNTEPIIRVIAESRTMESAEALARQIMDEINTMLR